MSYRFCWLLASGIRMETSSILIPLASSQQNLYDIYLLLCIRYETPDDGKQTCPKHVEFYSKNKFEKLVHLLGFIIRIYHDARSSKFQKCFTAPLIIHSIILSRRNCLKGFACEGLCNRVASCTEHLIKP